MQTFSYLSSRWLRFYATSYLKMKGWATKQLSMKHSSLAGIPCDLIKRMQSVINFAVRLVYSASRYDRITPLLTQLHWLKVPERFRVPDGRPGVQMSPPDGSAVPRCRISPVVPRRGPSVNCRLSTIGDRALPVDAFRRWNGTLCCRTSRRRRH